MDDAEQPEKGRLTPHTPPDQRQKSGDLPSRDDIAQAVAALRNEIDSDDADQLDLIEGSPDLDAIDALSAAANSIARPRRERGGRKDRLTSAIRKCSNTWKRSAIATLLLLCL